MKLLRFGAAGEEKPGILDAHGTIRDVSALILDIDGSALTLDKLATWKQLPLDLFPVVSPNVRIGPCVANVGKFVCIGQNYADHAAESGMPIPKEPAIFLKATSAICGAYDNIVKPPGSTKLDWEVELGVVIGHECAYVCTTQAAKNIAGYCVINDVSERGYQLERGGQWTKGKGSDTFAPVGPWLLTSDEIENINSLDLWLKVNGQFRQRGNTVQMIFKPHYLVSYVSQFMSLQPGDIISTGTPSGVGMGMSPPQYLNCGDRVTLGISGLGRQKQTVVPHPIKSRAVTPQ